MAPGKEHIGAVGAGRMGRGIAIAFAYAGHPVSLIDLKPRDAGATLALEADIRAEVRRDLDFLVRVAALTGPEAEEVAGLIHFASHRDAAEILVQCDVVFEGVPEIIKVKAEAFAFISAHVRRGAIVASTASTIDADTLSAFVGDPERFLNAHWLNPAYLMPLVELSPSGRTAPEVVKSMRELLVKIGKVPIVCKTSPGYIVPRIQALAMNEAARMVEEGIASAEDIDTAVRVGFGLRFAVLGLLEFIDWGGGDILYHASNFLTARLDKQRFQAPAVIADNMKYERRGLRDGIGFYNYQGIDTEAYRDERLSSFVALLRNRNLMPRRPGKAASE